MKTVKFCPSCRCRVTYCASLAGQNLYQCSCHDCDMVGPAHPDEDEAIRLWSQMKPNPDFEWLPIEDADCDSGWISPLDRLPENGQDVAFILGKSSNNNHLDYLAGRILGGRYIDNVTGFSIPGLGGLSVIWWKEQFMPPKGAVGDSQS